MIGGTFGPWAILLGHSVSGVDFPNHGWLAAVFAALGSVAFADYLRRPCLWKAALGAVSGAAGVAVALYDRHEARHAFSGIHIGLVQALQSFARIGWGLNLTMAASITMALAGLVLAIDHLVARRPTSSSDR